MNQITSRSALTLSNNTKNQTWISGSATTYCFNSLSPNARETARTPPTLQVPVVMISTIKNTNYKSCESFKTIIEKPYQPTLQILPHPQSVAAHQFGLACDLLKQL